MGFKRKSKVSAEFSMSSLTDIIFLLLIFFMLTSNFVKIEPFDLPESDSKTVAATSVVVSIDKAGVYKLNNLEIRSSQLKAGISSELNKATDQQDAKTVTIVAEKGVPFDKVVDIMKIAGDLRAKTILATQATKS